MNKIILVILSIIFLGFANIALADRIVAIVEDTSITLTELEQRKKLLGYFNHVKSLSSAEDKAYTNMVLQSMIDDAVLVEYSKTMGIIVTPKEIDIFIINIEQNGKLQPVTLANHIVKGLGLPLLELRNKMKVEIIRSKVVREALSRNVNISQDDVESMVLATNFKDAKIKLKDLAGDRDHYSLEIHDPSFENIPLIKQHKLVNTALSEVLHNRLHAITIKTKHD